jgi:uncharacterized RDD family membrane protein YckC
MPESVDPKHVQAITPGPAVPLVRGTAAAPGSGARPGAFAEGIGSRIIDLIAGTARVGVSASTLVAGEITRRSVTVARVLLPNGIAEGPLDAIERQVRRHQDEARKSEHQVRDDMTKAAESVLNRVAVDVVDMLDMEQLIDHVPINRIVAQVDLPAVINEIDLTGIIREGTKRLGGETLDSARIGLMAMDVWSARIVDRVLRRKRPRDLKLRSNDLIRPQSATKPGGPVSQRRTIRNERAQELQGQRAGFMTRAVASGTDVALVLCVYVGGFLVTSIAWDLFFSRSIAISVPPHWVNELVVWIILVLYLTAGWGFAGRTLGKQMMGLRVVGSDGSRLRFWRAFLRAVLCASFFPVLLLALVSRRNRGLEDLALATVVIYDWIPEVEAPSEEAPAGTPREIALGGTASIAIGP